LGSLVAGIGYIGARLAERLLDAGEAVVGLDNLFSTDPEAIERLAQHPSFRFVEGNAADDDDVGRAFGLGIPIDTVYHLAGQSSARADAAPIRFTEEANLVAPRVMLDRACEAGAHTFLFGSSLQIYGRRVSGQVGETHPFGPLLDMNHLSKVYVEKLMEMYSHNRGIRCVAARIGLVYGLGPVMKTDPRFMTAPNKFCHQAARGETLRIDAGGFQPTSMIHVDDVSRALVALSHWPLPGFSAVNLIGETASPAQVAEVVRRVARARGLDVSLEATPPETPIADCTFLSTLSKCAFTPERSLERDLPEVLDYFMNREDITPRPPLRRGEGEKSIPLPVPGRGAGGLGPEASL